MAGLGQEWSVENIAKERTGTSIGGGGGREGVHPIYVTAIQNVEVDDTQSGERIILNHFSEEAIVRDQPLYSCVLR